MRIIGVLHTVLYMMGTRMDSFSIQILPYLLVIVTHSCITIGA